MHVALVLAQIDATRRTITAVVFALLAVAAALALLTAWYWRITDPRRQGGSKKTPPPRRRRADRGSSPKADPSPGGASAAPATASPASGSVAGKDQTRLMNRDAILDSSQSPEAQGTSPPVIHQPPAAQPKVPETTIDLRESESHPSDRRPTNAASPPGQSARGRVASGAHDEGLSLEEWLALGEED